MTDGAVFFLLLLLLAVFGLYRLFTRGRRIAAKLGLPAGYGPQAWEAFYALENQRALRTFGESEEERRRRIDEAFDVRTATIQFRTDWRKRIATGYHVKVAIGRSLPSMPPREREALRTAYQLYNAGLSQEGIFWIARLGLIYADGKGIVYDGAIHDYRFARSLPEAIRQISSTNVEASINLVLQALDKALRAEPERPLLKALRARLLGDAGDLAPAEPLKAAPRGDLPAHGLVLGLDETDPALQWYYDGEGSLLTVAPPGSGKTQCHVFPNLLQWPGPAVVLDVKGEIYAGTSKWRVENVGPVYRFNPLDPANSHSYNPLTAVRSDLDFLWEDSGLLADMMIVPGKDPFWENSARSLVTAAIAYVCVRDGPRPMADVMAILHGVGWDRFIGYLKGRTDFAPMHQAGHSLDGESSVTRDGIKLQALSNLSAWEGRRISRATLTSDWNPLDLRGGANPTVYICLRPNEIDNYLSLLRVMIAQHIRVLTAELPPRDTQPILFLLDELPRLRYMPPIETALETGRQFGLRLWMFTQSLGQLKIAYANADGMVASCAVRLFMNPSLYDGTAQKLSDDIGLRDSIVDGTRVKIVEPNVLAGPDFKDSIIVMAPPAKAARLRKSFAYADADLAERMGSL